MKFSALTTFLAFNFIFSSLGVEDSFAQETSYSIGVSARVVESIEMITLRDMRFGPVQPGQEQIVIDPLSDSETGKMIAMGLPNARIRVSFVRERILTNGNETIVFTYEIAGNDQDDQSSAEILQTDNRNLDLNNEGEYYFWIGGQVDIQDAKPGKYDGDFTIEVEYI
jgi:hypothetical protein